MTDSEQNGRGGTHCPNCGLEGSHDLGQDGFDEFRCTNGNCSVEVYRVER